MFQALELSLDVIRSLRAPLEALRARDPDLYRQIRRAASSVALNLAEGAERAGKDRLHHYRIASGSAKEVQVALRVAEAWGDVQAPAMAQTFHLLDRLAAVLWRLAH
jgi:four helix bundle protein